MQSLPVELVQRIFSFVDLRRVLKHRRLCVRINACLLDPFFAALIVTRQLPAAGAPSRLAAELDALWFRLPDALQRHFAQRRWTARESLAIDAFVGAPLPAAVGVLGRVAAVRVASNHFRGANICGAIPRELGALPRLALLDLHSCDIEGAVPGELAALPVLASLDLHNCKLSGPLPTPFAPYPSLKFLNLSQNKALQGPLPDDIWKLPSLLSLNLNYCSGLAGLELPETFDPAVPLQELHLTGCGFTGPIPFEIYKLSSLQVLHLGKNKFRGEIPGSLALLRNLGTLFLDFNELEGSIPELFQRFKDQLKCISIFEGNSDLIPTNFREWSGRIGRMLTEDARYHSSRNVINARKVD